jgi:hypothetical protein
MTYVDYRLHSLGWKAFQDLSLVILAEVFGQSLQLFSPVRDGGRDGAFAGPWSPQPGTELSGLTVVQCKFTASATKRLSVQSLEPELQKAQQLVAAGNTNYVLVTNHSLPAPIELQLRDAFLSVGFAHFVGYGNEWLSAKITERPRIRRLVPRVYGLGDLSEILDTRIYEQTAQLLAAERDNLSKFVPTEAYRNAVTALEQHGFVLLLGRAAAGKSTIASTVSLASPDAWNCTPIKIERLADFKSHWNPNVSGQLFWIDDIFGSTQYLASLAHEWNSLTPFVKAGVSNGCKVIATSRDYVYRHARGDLKKGAFPLLTESQVVVDVEALSIAEKEQILYNHVKLGNQPPKFKRAIKPFLPDLAQLDAFQPEVARRLGNQEFTRGLALSREAMVKFVEQPHELLKDIIVNLSVDDRAALATIFVGGGSIVSPVTLSDTQRRTLERLGGSEAAVVGSLNAMKDSLVRLTQRGLPAWGFQHPTIADAFAETIADNPELVDVYLRGVGVDSLISEITCGDIEIENAKIRVPEASFEIVAQRLGERLLEIESLGTSDYNAAWHMKRNLYAFLSSRCSSTFLRMFFGVHPELVERCLHLYSYLSVVPETDIFILLAQNGMLDVEQRRRALKSIERLAVQSPDADFLRMPRLREILTAEEILDILARVEKDLIGDLDNEIEGWNDSYDNDDDPHGYYDPYIEALEAYRVEFATCPVSSRALARGIKRLEEIRSARTLNFVPKEETSDLTLGQIRETPEGSRSIFDDVDL